VAFSVLFAFFCCSLFLFSFWKSDILFIYIYLYLRSYATSSPPSVSVPPVITPLHYLCTPRPTLVRAWTTHTAILYGLTQPFLNSLVHHFPLPPSFLPLHNRYPFLPTETVKSRYDVPFLYTSLTEHCNRVFFCSFSLVVISIIFPIVTIKFSWQYEFL